MRKIYSILTPLLFLLAMSFHLYYDISYSYSMVEVTCETNSNSPTNGHTSGAESEKELIDFIHYSPSPLLQNATKVYWRDSGQLSVNFLCSIWQPPKFS